MVEVILEGPKENVEEAKRCLVGEKKGRNG